MLVIACLLVLNERRFFFFKEVIGFRIWVCVSVCLLHVILLIQTFVLISQVRVLLYIVESGMDRYISKFEKLLVC